MVPKVSILAPSYCHEAYIGACLESVLAQTMPDWELIVIDDCSRDRTVETARSYAARDSRIRVLVNEQNLGTYGTQQKALELARAPLIAVIDTDDLWKPEKLARQTELLDRHPEASFCFTLGCQVDAQGGLMPDADIHGDWPKEEACDLLPWLLEENRALASSVVFRREGLRFVPQCRYSGDWVALVEASTRGRAACVLEDLTLWRVHSSNAHYMSSGLLVEEIWVREALLRQSPAWPASRTPEGGARQSLAVLNLLALYAAAGMRGRAAVLLPIVLALPRALRGLKRWAAAMLPRRMAVARLWPESAETLMGYSANDLSRALKGRPRLTFQRPGQ